MLQTLEISENSKTGKKQSNDRLMISAVGVLQAIRKGNDENKNLNYFYR